MLYDLGCEEYSFGRRFTVNMIPWLGSAFDGVERGFVLR
jgi:hypothetical protein